MSVGLNYVEMDCDNGHFLVMGMKFRVPLELPNDSQLSRILSPLEGARVT
jgi:hypothetical protein